MLAMPVLRAVRHAWERNLHITAAAANNDIIAMRIRVRTAERAEIDTRVRGRDCHEEAKQMNKMQTDGDIYKGLFVVSLT